MRFLVKGVSIIIIMILVVNLTLMIMGIVSPLLFWLVVILGAISSYVIKRIPHDA